MNPATAHALGKRDAVAEIMMIARDGKDDRTLLRELAQQLLAVDPEHPHAKWYLENRAEKPVIVQKWFRYKNGNADFQLAPMANKEFPDRAAAEEYIRTADSGIGGDTAYRYQIVP